VNWGLRAFYRIFTTYYFAEATQFVSERSTKDENFIIMRRITTYRLLLAAAILASSYSFFRVNSNVACATGVTGKSAELMEQKDQTNRAKSLPIPDLTILQKALDLLKKII
jgi:hypothetical protein